MRETLETVDADVATATIEIVNNCGRSVVVLRPVAGSSTDSSDPPTQGMLQQLELLTLSTGGTTLLDDTSATISAVTGPDDPSGAQELYLCEAATLFPVHATVATPDSESDGYATITLTKANVASTAMALNFVRNLMANPASDLALGFSAALSAGVDSETGDVDPIVDEFFAANPPFTTVTFSDWLAVSTWTQAYAYLWGMADNGSPGRSYTLYASPFFTNVGAVPKGTIDFERPTNAPLIAPPDDHLSGFRATFTPSSGDPIDLGFDTRVLASSNAEQQLSLTGSFAYPTWLTSDANSPGLWPMLAGTLNGEHVVAVSLDPAPGNTPAPSDGRDWLFWLLTGISLFGTAVSLTAAAVSIRNWAKNRNPNRPPTDEETRQARLTADAVEGRVRRELDRLVDEELGGDQHVLTREQFAEAIGELRTNLSETMRGLVEGQTEGAIAELQDQLAKLAEIRIDTSIEESMGRLVEANETLSKNVREALKQVDTVRAELPKIVENLGSAVSKELRESIEESIKAVTDVSDVAKEILDKVNEVEDGEAAVEDDAAPIDEL